MFIKCIICIIIFICSLFIILYKKIKRELVKNLDLKIYDNKYVAYNLKTDDANIDTKSCYVEV